MGKTFDRNQEAGLPDQRADIGRPLWRVLSWDVGHAIDPAAALAVLTAQRRTLCVMLSILTVQVPAREG
jgi:hypothetical protein